MTDRDPNDQKLMDSLNRDLAFMDELVDRLVVELTKQMGISQAIYDESLRYLVEQKEEQNGTNQTDEELDGAGGSPGSQS